MVIKKTEVEKRHDRIWKKFNEVRRESPESVSDFRICKTIAPSFRMTPQGVWTIITKFKSGYYTD